jgi:microcystin-dependent protein
MSQSTRYQTGTSGPLTTSELVVFDYEIDSKILAEIDSKIATAESEISTETDTKIATAKGEITTEIDSKIATAESEISTETDTKIATAKGEITTETDTKIATAKGEITTEIDSKIATAMPNGAIIMWSGSTPPPGWTLCDGNGGNKINNLTIPDLRGRFIVGAGGNYEIDAVGGTEMVTLTESQLPRHRHAGETGNMSGNENHSHSLPGNQPTVTTQTDEVGIVFRPDLTYTNTVFDNRFPIPAGEAINETSVAHTHLFTTDYIGSNEAHENRPPYYALAYIIKTN